MTNKTLSDLSDELGQWQFPCDCGDHRHGIIITMVDEACISMQMKAAGK